MGKNENETVVKEEWGEKKKEKGEEKKGKGKGRRGEARGGKKEKSLPPPFPSLLQ